MSDFQVEVPDGPPDRDLRDVLGEHVREVWIAWAKEQKDPKPSWLVPWSDLPEPDREVDRRIGEVLFGEGEIQGVAKMACRMADAIEIARREGAAEMREKAAFYVESKSERSSSVAVSVFDVLAAHIRKLEPQTTNPKPQTTPPRRGGS